MAAPMALAQTAERVEKIEITGSRIPSPNLESASPVAVISAEDIKFEGLRNVESLLNNLPQVFAELGGSVSNGATGTATVNLRNIGSTRTLVLMNGRRLPPGSPRTGAYAADLNQVPAPLIQRIEVLTGGASAVYGSDAVAGVVNFIMRDNFEGVQGDVNYSFYNHSQHNSVSSIIAGREATNPGAFHVPGDANQVGESTDVSLLMGGNFANNKGNATVFLGYKKDQPLLQAKYDYSACSFNPTAAGFVCGGSTTSAPGRVVVTSSNILVPTDAAGNVRQYNGNTDAFNFAPYNYYQRPSERYSFHASAHYEIARNVRLYSEFGFHDDHTVAQIAPSGLFGIPVTLAFENPMLSQAWRTGLGLTGPGTTADVIIQRRNVEGGGRQDDIRHTSYRTVVGVKGDVAKHWDYDVFMQTSKVIYQEIYRNDFSIARGTLAVDAVRDAAGNTVCRSTFNGTDATGLCAPYNVFASGGVTQAALDYLQTPGLQKGFTSQKIQGATLTGDLGNYNVRVPGAKSGIGVAFGIERRVEELQLEVDSAFTTGDLAGQGGPTVGRGGKLTVKDYFAEARIPIIERGEMLASLSGSYRYSDYSTGVSTDTYGIGAEFSPFRVVKLRGSYQQAVRAANINELFSAQALGLFAMNSDPCAGAAPSRSRADCARTGVTAAQYGNILDNTAGQYNQLTGGNPNLKPETAKTASLGLVLTPTRNMNASVDYWQIKIDEVISPGLPSPIVLQQCLDTGAFCDLITRDRLGTLWLLPQAQIIATNLNLSKVKVSGVDFAVNYNQPIGRWGGLGISFLGTWSKEFITEPIPGLGEYDCNGLHGATCLVPQPEWRHKLRFSWSTPWSMDLALTWRHIAKVEVDVSSSNPLLTGSFSPVDKELGARDYIDIAGSWSFSKRLTIRAGVNNVFDKDPPLGSTPALAAVFGNGNTYPQVYDALGRRVFVGATLNF